MKLIRFLCFMSATRETAFLHAISSAAITHELTLQCRLNRIPGCKCAKTRKQPKADSGWQWGGCSDDIKFGEKETRRFIDKLEKGNVARTAFNLHNNEVGRKVTAIFLFSPHTKKLRISPLLYNCNQIKTIGFLSNWLEMSRDVSTISSSKRANHWKKT